MSHNHEGPVAEIERKWVLKNLPNLPIIRQREIWHYYTPEGRVTRDIYPGPGGSTTEKYILCVKKALDIPGGNSEDEHEISWKEFLERTSDSPLPLRKTRYDLNVEGKKWEVDVFIDIVLVMAEVEWIFPLDAIDEEEVKNFQVPNEMKKYIIAEVTGSKEYSNYALSKEIETWE
jgi:hypothetical protein